MAMSNKERQAAYRQRMKKARSKSEDGYRINTVVDLDTYFRLERLAKHYAVTKRQCIENLLKTAEKALMDGMSDTEISDYLNPN